MSDQIDTSASTVSVAAATKPTSNGNGRIAWPGGPAKKQYFSLPDNIIYYMIQNPSSPEVYLKLAMSCKYFFEKKPLLIVANIDDYRFCSSEDRKECHKKKYKCCVKVDLAKLTTKVWLTDHYYFTATSPVNALLLQKLYKWENALFQVYFGAITFENFKLTSSIFNKVRLCRVKMLQKDGNVVMFEEILGSLSDVKEFYYFFKFAATEATAFTMKNICELGNFDNLRLFRLYDIPELFDVKVFKNFIMKHKNTKFWLRFRKYISVAYQTQLHGFCDTVIAVKACKCVIEYSGQNQKKLAIMRERYDT